MRSPAQGPLPRAGLSIGLGGNGPDRTYRKKVAKARFRTGMGQPWVSQEPIPWPAVSSGRKQQEAS